MWTSFDKELKKDEDRNLFLSNSIFESVEWKASAILMETNRKKTMNTFLYIGSKEEYVNLTL